MDSLLLTRGSAALGGDSREGQERQVGDANVCNGLKSGTTLMADWGTALGRELHFELCVWLLLQTNRRCGRGKTQR